MFFVEILIICLSSLVTEDKATLNCPLENGEVVPSIAGFVRGERGDAGVKIITSKENYTH